MAHSEREDSLFGYCQIHRSKDTDDEYGSGLELQLQVLRTMLTLLEELDSPDAIIKKNMISNWVNVSVHLSRLNRGINSGPNINL